MINLLKSRKYVHVVLALLIIFCLMLMYFPWEKLRDFARLGTNVALTVLALSLVVCNFTRLKRLLPLLRSKRPAAKQGYGLLGSVFFHLGIVLLLLGFVVNSGWSFRGKMFLPEGVTFKVPQDLYIVKKGLLFDTPPQLEVALDKFTYGQQLTRNGKSAVRPVADLVFRDAKGDSRQQVKVNYPANYAGLVWRYLESGYSPYVSISSPEGIVVDDFINIATQDESSWHDQVPVSKEQKLEIYFYPDFVETARHVYGSRSSFLNQPVLDLIFWEKGQKLGRVLVPMGQSRDMGQLRISFKNVRYWQLLDVGNDPGKVFIYAGGMIMVFGLGWRVFCLSRKTGGTWIDND